MELVLPEGQLHYTPSKKKETAWTALAFAPSTPDFTLDLRRGQPPPGFNVAKNLE
jgi:hypothetical protein